MNSKGSSESNTQWVKNSEKFGKRGTQVYRGMFHCSSGREREREGGEGYGEDSLSFDFCGVQCHPI